MSAVCYIPGQDAYLLQPDFEAMWVKPGTNLQHFPVGHLGDPTIEDSYAKWMNQLKGHIPHPVRQIGVELDFGSSAPAFNASEALLPDSTWRAGILSAFPDSELVDCVPMLADTRGIKDETEINLLRRANRIAGFGLDALKKAIQPGLSEVEAAAVVESSIRVKGTGFEGAQLVQAFAQVTAGAEGTYRQSMLTPSSLYRFKNGDLVMIELGVCVDGYWSDLTRVYCVGKTDREQIRVYNAVRRAQQMAAQALRAGARWGDPDRAARQALEEAGLLDYFKHGTGHGIGCRYHEPIPQLGPAHEELLRPGMVTSVEPGVYIPGFGGIRIEDNLAVTSAEADWLSEPVEPW
jgi:Xaa-Pro aminopeptidase